MNKKNLSVVLAGAMLATSVAPVLADTTAKEYSVDDIKLLEKELVSTMETEMLTTNTALYGDGSKATDFLSKGVIDLLGKDVSAYGVVLLDAKGNKVDETYKTIEVVDLLEKAKAGYTVKLVRRETSDFYGQLIPGTSPRKTSLAGKYDPSKDFTKTAIEANGDTYSKIVVETKASDNLLLDSTTEKNTAKATDALIVDDVANPTKLTVYTNKSKNPADSSKKVTITLTKDSDKIDGRLPLTEDGKLLDYKVSSDIAKFDHFDTLGDWEASKVIETEATEKAVYKITSAKEDVNAIKVSDLYDGMLLTAKGTELLADLTNAAEEIGKKVEEVTKTTNSPALVKLQNNPDLSTDAAVYKFTVKYYKNDTDAKANKNEVKTVTVHSTNKDEINALYKLLNTGKFNVGVVGGENRYATAVNVAKQQNINVKDKKNIVLVNGNSLVDGLAAAPLAAKKEAPVLLTKADSLPEETKEYIKTVTNGATNAEKKAITINLVGGESVLSSSLVKELEDMGFYVKRLGGSNREATSLKVAEEIVSDKNSNKNAAFIVGGNGEADAMAISAVAAKEETPIIVSSVNGISEDALEYLKENSAKGNVAVVGGESVVSASELEEINDSLTLNKASRIAGENRFETNAKIIEKFYGDGTKSEAIILAKDGVAKKSELVDALSAANYAVKIKAPIVLASSELKDSQKDILVNKFDSTALAKVVRVGNGAERSVIETVAKLFGIKNDSTIK